MILTPDGGQFVLAWANESQLSSSNERPIILVYPGLVSNTNSMYVNKLTASIIENDYTVVVMVNRGLEAPCLVSVNVCKLILSQGVKEQAVEYELSIAGTFEFLVLQCDLVL